MDIGILNNLGYHEFIIHCVGGGLGVSDLFAPLKNWLKVWNFNVGISIEANSVLVPNMIKKDKSLSRHPGYEKYKKRTSLLFPFIW